MFRLCVEIRGRFVYWQSLFQWINNLCSWAFCCFALYVVVLCSGLFEIF